MFSQYIGMTEQKNEIVIVHNKSPKVATEAQSPDCISDEDMPFSKPKVAMKSKVQQPNVVVT